MSDFSAFVFTNIDFIFKNNNATPLVYYIKEQVLLLKIHIFTKVIHA